MPTPEGMEVLTFENEDEAFQYILDECLKSLIERSVAAQKTNKKPEPYSLHSFLLHLGVHAGQALNGYALIVFMTKLTEGFDNNYNEKIMKLLKDSVADINIQLGFTPH